MRHRIVSDLMTTPVVSVRREATFKEIAQLLAEYDVTAVPVVDDHDRPVGVVSEADLLHEQAGQPDPAGLLPAPHQRPGERTEARATTADGLMTSPAVVARPEWTAVEAARMMERHHVKRLPVVDGTGRLIGVLSRADLLRVFLRRDHEIRDEITEDVLKRALRIAPTAVTAHVTDGRVTLSGTVERKSLIPIAVGLCSGVDGVVDVSDQLSYRLDDTGSPAAGVSSPHRTQL